MSDSTASVLGAATSGTWSPPGSWSERTWKPQTRDRLEDLTLQHRLAALDRARTSDERLAAQQRVLALGPEAIPSVLAELSSWQPPDRADVLIELLVKRESPDRVIELARKTSVNWELRASLAEALARCASATTGGNQALRRRIAETLVVLAGDRDVSVRGTAIDAIGLAHIADEPEVRALLERVAEHDRDPGVQAEARAILDESD